MKSSFAVVRASAAIVSLAPLSACLDSTREAAPDDVVHRDGELSDREFESFSGSEYSSRYHIYAEHIDPSKSIGLLVYGDGTGEHGFDNPDSSHALGGSQGIVAQGRQRNMIVLVPESPNDSCNCFHSGDPSGYAEWFRELIEEEVYAEYDVDRGRVWLTGYSSGAQFVTRFVIPRHSDLFEGGGAVVFGGGGPPSGSVDDFAPSFIENVHMHWYTGQDDGDNGGFQGYDGPYGAIAGHDWYEDRGFETSAEYPPGVNHNELSGRFGRVIGEQLDLHDDPQGNAGSASDGTDPGGSTGQDPSGATTGSASAGDDAGDGNDTSADPGTPGSASGDGFPGEDGPHDEGDDGGSTGASAADGGTAAGGCRVTHTSDRGWLALLLGAIGLRLRRREDAR